MSELRDTTGVDRRQFLRIGGSVVALSAIVAACGTDEGVGPEGVASAGSAAPLATVNSQPVTDVVLLRTATSLHYNAIDIVDKVMSVDGLDGEIAAAADLYRGLLQEQADALAEATTDAGGQPFEQSNPVVASRIVGPAATLLDASETMASDAARLLHATADLAAATHQAFVALLAEPALRMAAMSIGATHAKVASALAGLISPENLTTADEISVAEPAGLDESTDTTVDAGLPTTSVAAPATTQESSGVPDVEVYVIPSAFGALSAVQVVLGRNGVEDDTKRRQLNLETPSLNSLVY